MKRKVLTICIVTIIIFTISFIAVLSSPPTKTEASTFLGAIETRSKPVSDIEQGYITATACILANMACKLGRTLVWDPDKGQVVGDAEANRLLRRPYRSPWKHPEPDRV